MKKNIIKIILGVLIIFSTSAWSKTKVTDGDSLEIDGQRIRLVGIDAPEYFQYCYNSHQEKYQCGQSSKDFLINLVGKDEVRCDCENEPDKYNRKLCECFVGDININSEIIKHGWAIQYRSHKYDAEEKYAKQHKKGIWKGKFMRPALYRALNRQNNYRDKK